MPSVPIVMYTLYKTEELESAAKLVGVRAVVGKEDGVRSLLTAVDAELAAKQKPAQSLRMLRQSAGSFSKRGKTVYRPSAASEIVSKGSVLVSKNITMHSENFFF